MQIFRSSKGSATVEAAFVFPLVILTALGLFSVGIRMYEKTKLLSAENKGYSAKIIFPSAPAEKILRFKWMGINIIGEPED